MWPRSGRKRAFIPVLAGDGFVAANMRHSTMAALPAEGAMAHVASEEHAFDPGLVLADLRFRALMSEPHWDALPPPIRWRFSRRVGAGATSVYAGLVLETRMSRLGLLLAQAARLIGGPLPTATDAQTVAFQEVAP
jgi:hypothetical protein